MSKLQYSKKRLAYEKGDRQERRIFKFFDEKDISVHAVRKYKNDEDSFKTVEIRLEDLERLVEPKDFKSPLGIDGKLKFLASLILDTCSPFTHDMSERAEKELKKLNVWPCDEKGEEAVCLYVDKNSKIVPVYYDELDEGIEIADQFEKVTKKQWEVISD